MITTVRARNVHDALPEGCYQVLRHGQLSESRVGRVRMIRGPFITEYARPKERVLFWAARDANPFFHFFESLWMLAGRRDVAYVAQFSKQIEQYSDDGKILNGAYGYRWRKQFGFDQLREIITALKANPNCRRQVLMMWAHFDLDHKNPKKDVPCNTTAYFQVANGQLDMTVCNRSNDLIWGAYGANAVHFSFLQEYVAAMTGIPVGQYYQISANTHVYERHFDLMDSMAELVSDVYVQRAVCPYSAGRVVPYPLIENPAAWDDRLDSFLRGFATNEPFFEFIAEPMRRSFVAFQNLKGHPDRIKRAITELNRMPADNDWRLACEEWLQRREP